MVRLQLVLLLMLIMLVTPRASYAGEACLPGSDPDQIIESCTSEINSGHLGRDDLAVAYTKRAEAWSEKSDFDKALVDSNKALGFNPKCLEALSARGLAWQGKEEYDKSISDYSAVIDGSSEHTSSWWLSTVYMRRGAAWGLKGNLDDAIADSCRAIGLDPEAARAFYNRGLAWKLKGRHDRAIEDYKRALEINPADPRALKKYPREWEKMSETKQADFLFNGLRFSGIIFTSPEVSRGYDSQQTRFGNAIIGAARKGMGVPDTILFNGRKVFERDASYLSFHGNYALRDTDVLLFGINCGGTNCGPDTLNFLIVGPDGAADVVSSPEFYSADGTMVARREEDRVVVDLGFERQFRKAATLLQSGKLTVQYTETEAIPLESEVCASLYETISRDCISYKGLKFDCEEHGRNYFGGGSVAMMAGITALENHPGFVSSAVGDFCVAACKTGRAATFDQFKKSVCSIK